MTFQAIVTKYHGPTKMGWGGKWHRGGMPEGNGNVYVSVFWGGEGPEFAFETEQGA